MEKVIVDIGTGDGRFVYSGAELNPQNFYIGIDPALKQAEKYIRKANRERLTNLEFLTASVENLPDELTGRADEVYVNFPWGSLLAGIALPDQNVISNICKVLKPGGILEITFGYSQDAEPSETARLNLDTLTAEKVKDEIIPEFEKNGLILSELREMNKSDSFSFESTWGKKLSFGQDRKIFRLKLIKKAGA